MTTHVVYFLLGAFIGLFFAPVLAIVIENFVVLRQRRKLEEALEEALMVLEGKISQLPTGATSLGGLPQRYMSNKHESLN